MIPLDLEKKRKEKKNRDPRINSHDNNTTFNFINSHDASLADDSCITKSQTLITNW